MKRVLPLIGLSLLAPSAWARVDLPEWAGAVPEGLRFQALGIEYWQWLALAALMVTSLVVAAIGRALIQRLAGLRKRLLNLSVSHATSEGIKRSCGLLLALMLWYAALPDIGLDSEPYRKAFFVLEFMTILGSLWLVISIWDAVCDSMVQRTAGVDARAERLLIPVTRKLVRFILIVAGFLSALGVFGVNVAGLLAGVGIGGLAVALAAKDSVENIFGSLTILFDMPFALGDWVRIDKVEGVVEQINLRSTRLRTFEDSIITLPNSNFIKASVENFGARRVRRQKLSLRVSYDTKPEAIGKFNADLRDYIKTIPAVQDERTIVELNDMSETSMGILVQCFFESETYQAEAHERNNLMLEILRLGHREGVLFAAPPRPPEPPEA